MSHNHTARIGAAIKFITSVNVVNVAVAACGNFRGILEDKQRQRLKLMFVGDLESRKVNLICVIYTMVVLIIVSDTYELLNY